MGSLQCPILKIHDSALTIPEHMWFFHSTIATLSLDEWIHSPDEAWTKGG